MASLNKFVSVDFDDTLTEKEVYDFVQSLLSRFYYVYICTARPYEIGGVKIKNQDLFDCKKMLGNNVEIIFTSYEDKSIYIPKHCLFHLDNCQMTCDEINSNSNVPAIVYKHNGNWRKEIEFYLEIKK